MIGYEGVTVRDFGMYFHNAWVWKYDASADEVAPYYLNVHAITEEREDEYVEDVNLRLHLAKDTSVRRNVSGYALTHNPEYIIHRFELEYVPVGPTKLVRVSLEPNDRRAFKGARIDMLRVLPLLDGLARSNTSNRLLRSMGELVSFPQQEPPEQDLVIGIAKVLTVGLAPCMGRNFGRQEATARALRTVRDMFEGSTDTVCVPTFSTALVRAHVAAHKAAVLHRGRLIGTLSYTDEGSLVYYPDDSAASNAQTRKVLLEGYTKLAMNTFADEVRWPHSSINAR